MRKFTALLAGLVLLTSSSFCNKAEEDLSSMMAGLALMGGSGTGTGTATGTDTEDRDLVEVPTALTGNSSSLTTSSISRDVLPPQAASSIQGIYHPVRVAIHIGSDILSRGGEMKEHVEDLAEAHPDMVGQAIAHSRNGEEQVALISDSSTYGAGGKKLEIWWADTGADVLRDGVKFIEMDFTDDGAGNIDGVLFMRHVDENNPTEFMNVRLEYLRDSSNAGDDRKAVIHMQNMRDFKNNVGNAAFYIHENSAGNVTVDGSYSMTGMRRPFFNDNSSDTTDWGTGTERAYIFSTAGLDSSDDEEETADTLTRITTEGQGVVKVILPKNGEETNDTSVFDSGNTWGLGGMHTTAILAKLNADSVSDCSTATTALECINLILAAESAATLTLTSTQAELLAALDIMEASASCTTGCQMFVGMLKTIAGLQNPAYFLQTDIDNILIGHANTSGLDALPGIDETVIANYATLEGLLRTTVRDSATGDDGGDFTSSGIFALDILGGTSVAPISGHEAGPSGWSGADDAIPTDVITPGAP